MAERIKLRIFSEDWVDTTPGARVSFLKKNPTCKHTALINIDGKDVGVLQPREKLDIFFDDEGKIESFEACNIGS